MSDRPAGDQDHQTVRADLKKAVVMVVFGSGWMALSVLIYYHFAAGTSRLSLQLGGELVAAAQMIFGALMFLFGLFLLLGSLAKTTRNRIQVMR